MCRFVAGTAPCQPRWADFVMGAIFCEHSQFRGWYLLLCTSTDRRLRRTAGCDGPAVARRWSDHSRLLVESFRLLWLEVSLISLKSHFVAGNVVNIHVQISWQAKALFVNKLLKDHSNRHQARINETEFIRIFMARKDNP